MGNLLSIIFGTEVRSQNVGNTLTFDAAQYHKRSENKQRLFHYTALTDCFCNRDGVCLLRGTNWVFIYTHLKPSGYYMYHQV
jgi:hypothetical protein